jgi:ParB family chromosome partitioning protein
VRKTSGNLALTGFEDIFNVDTTVTPAGTGGERIKEIPLSELFPPEFHPFQVNDDEAMKTLVESVKQYGVREPGLVRKRVEGGYELLSGNRRKMACELAGLTSMPVIIHELTDDEAAIVMVDSNLLHRERILPSEKAWAYRVKMETLNHSGIKDGVHSVEVIAGQTGESKNQIFRLIRLTELVIGLLDMVDAKKLSFNPAVELSYLSQKEQSAVVAAMAKYEVKPSLSQAVRLKKMKKDGTLTPEAIDSVLAAEKKSMHDEPTDSMKFRKFFPPEYSKKQIEVVIIGLLRDWQAAQIEVVRL